ncbi:MAG TPA: cysteine--tRNA ligase [Firmicutes bacterium]|nr:cysteine--tRNA ligase [Bacillota bacterium]
MRVFNTLTGRKEEFTPGERGLVKIYVCGITPYAPSHIGHARPAVFWDVVRRYLEYVGYTVRAIQNFTDIDDKIIAASASEGLPPLELADKYARQYLNEISELGVKPMQLYPKASEHVGEIITMIETLIAKGHAYEVGGDVYFSVKSFEEYGKLSHRTLEEMKPGARVEINEMKEHPMDFALWKAAKPGEPSWPSPWGNGRPGWHIECSAMSAKYLGLSFDMHGGGTELIFPHHENEIAQSEAFSGVKPMVRYWVHNELVNIRGEKMSKSLGNVITIREMLNKFPARAIRLFLLSAHYRTPLNFSEEGMEAAIRGCERLQTALDNLGAFCRDSKPEPGGSVLEPLEDAYEKAQLTFHESMQDDFNTPGAIAAVFDLVRELNAHQEWLASHPASAANYLDGLARMVSVLGIADDPRKAQGGAGDSALVGELVNLTLELRQKARQEKDWATSDAVRARLGKLGILVEDGPTGTKWKRINPDGGDVRASGATRIHA